MKKCKGCGIELQTVSKQEQGYVVDINQDYCQRCFRLLHYGDTKQLLKENNDNRNIIDIYKKNHNSLFVLILDPFDALALKDDDILDYFTNEELVLIINKTDLFPKNISYHKLEKIYSKIIYNLNKKYHNIKAAIITNKYENHFNEQFLDLLKELNYKEIVFVGRANAGKSTLINKLCNDKVISESIYPGTTLRQIEIAYDDYVFIDTPGLIDKDVYINYLEPKYVKRYSISKLIKPLSYQLNQYQSYFYDGIFRIDINPKNKATIVFYLANDDIHRSNYKNADNYYLKHYDEFMYKKDNTAVNAYKIINKQLFIIKGLGMIKIVGNCDIRIHCIDNIRIYLSEVDI